VETRSPAHPTRIVSVDSQLLEKLSSPTSALLTSALGSQTGRAPADQYESATGGVDANDLLIAQSRLRSDAFYIVSTIQVDVALARQFVLGLTRLYGSS